LTDFIRGAAKRVENARADVQGRLRSVGGLTLEERKHLLRHLREASRATSIAYGAFDEIGALIRMRSLGL
jgi:hypothetical protein